MKYDKNKFKPVMMGVEAKMAYDELVNYYRYLTNSSQIEKLLVETFNQKMTELKNRAQCVWHVGEIGTPSLLEHEAIEELNKRFLIHTWDEQAEATIKIPMDKFTLVLAKKMKIKARDSILLHKKRIMSMMNLKQVRVGNQYFICHKNYIENKIDRNLLRFIEPAVEMIKKTGKINKEAVVQIINHRQAQKVFENNLHSFGVRSATIGWEDVYVMENR